MPKISLSAIRAQFPQYKDVSDQKLLIGLHRTMYPQWSSQQFYDSIDFDTERKPNATDGMSGLDKVRANLGAGMMDLVTGGKQLVTDMFGSDADSAQARADVEDKRALDRNLADNTTGGTALQIAGGVIPTLAIPALGAAQRVAAIPRAVGLAVDGGLAGGLYGATAPVGQNQSRAGNTAIGAGLGAALPLAVGGIRAGWQRATPSGRAARAQERAGADIAEAVAPNATSRTTQRNALQQTLDRVRQNQNQVGPRDRIPLSTAAQLNDPQLARLEAGSRARNGANWYDFDADQTAAVSDAFRNATAEAGDVAARRGAREANWNRNWNWAEQAVTPGRFANQRALLEQHLQQALRSGESSNPRVRAMLEHIQNEMERLGPDFGPANLQQIRANLSESANGMATDALSQAPRNAPATRRLLETIDNSLNDVTNQRWQAVRDNYAADSRLVDQSRAAGTARSQHFDPQSDRVRGNSIYPDQPQITQTSMGRAMDAAVENGQTQLSPSAVSQMERILAALRRQDIVKGVKRSATAGGGSNTASDLIADRAARQFGSAVGASGGPVGAVAGDMMAGAAQRAGNRADVMRDEVVAQALQTPDAMLQLLEQQIQRGQPLSEQMAGVYQMLVNRVRNRAP